MGGKGGGGGGGGRKTHDDKSAFQRIWGAKSNTLNGQNRKTKKQTRDMKKCEKCENAKEMKEFSLSFFWRLLILFPVLTALWLRAQAPPLQASFALMGLEKIHMGLNECPLMACFLVPPPLPHPCNTHARVLQGCDGIPKGLGAVRPAEQGLQDRENKVPKSAKKYRKVYRKARKQVPKEALLYELHMLCRQAADVDFKGTHFEIFAEVDIVVNVRNSHLPKS